MKSKSIIAVPAIESMSTENLRATAKAAGVKVGKSRKDTTANLLAAIDSGAVHFKANVYFSTNPAKQGETTKRVQFYGATLRTYKSGPGFENTVFITPAAPVHGSPHDPTDDSVS